MVTENWIVVFVFAELVALALLTALSCWCCRRSTRRAQDEEESHTLPMTVTTRQKAASRAVAMTTVTAGSANQDPVAIAHVEDSSDDDGEDSHDEHVDDDGLVSGGLWGFIAGYPQPSRSASSSKKNLAARQPSRDVEVVNLSVNTAVMVDEEEEKEDDDGVEKSELGAAAIDKKSGSAA